MAEIDWLFPTEALLSTPSIRKGINHESETGLRLRACRFIERCSLKLAIPHSLMSIAKILLHRFYMRVAIQECEYHDVASSLLFLCCKLGEGKEFQRISQIISVCGSDAKKSPIDIKEDSKEYQRWKETIMFYDEYVLVKLCFDLAPSLPHPIAIEIINRYNGSIQLRRLAFLYCDEA